MRAALHLLRSSGERIGSTYLQAYRRITEIEMPNRSKVYNTSHMAS
jgi:hypothetical protein